MRFRALAFIAVVLCVSISSCYYDNKESMYGTASCDTANVVYTTKISPLISQKCLGCHNPTNATAGVDLSSYAQAVKYAQSGQLKGTVNQLPGYETKLMPPSGKLEKCSLAQIDIWIRKGMPQ